MTDSLVQQRIGVVPVLDTETTSLRGWAVVLEDYKYVTTEINDAAKAIQLIIIGSRLELALQARVAAAEAEE